MLMVNAEASWGYIQVAAAVLLHEPQQAEEAAAVSGLQAPPDDWLRLPKQLRMMAQPDHLPPAHDLCQTPIPFFMPIQHR